MRYKVDVIRTRTWIGSITIDDDAIADEDAAEEAALKKANFEKTLDDESLATITWTPEDEFFESDGVEELEDDAEDQDQEP